MEISEIDPIDPEAKPKRIDLGLAILSALALPDTPLSVEDLAAWAGCHPSRIRQIEEAALRKLKRKLAKLGIGLEQLREPE